MKTEDLEKKFNGTYIPPLGYILNAMEILTDKKCKNIGEIYITLFPRASGVTEKSIVELTAEIMKKLAPQIITEGIDDLVKAMAYTEGPTQKVEGGEQELFLYKETESINHAFLSFYIKGSITETSIQALSDKMDEARKARGFIKNLYGRKLFNTPDHADTPTLSWVLSANVYDMFLINKHKIDMLLEPVNGLSQLTYTSSPATNGNETHAFHVWYGLSDLAQSNEFSKKIYDIIAHGGKAKFEIKRSAATEEGNKTP